MVRSWEILIGGKNVWFGISLHQQRIFFFLPPRLSFFLFSVNFLLSYSLAAKRAGIAVSTEAKGRSTNTAAAKGRKCLSSSASPKKKSGSDLGFFFFDDTSPLLSTFSHVATDYQHMAKLDMENEVKPPEKVDMRLVEHIHPRIRNCRSPFLNYITSSNALRIVSEEQLQKEERIIRMQKANQWLRKIWQLRSTRNHRL